MTNTLWGTLDSTGWIGDGPTGRDEAFLLLTPRGDGRHDAGAAMAAIIYDLGMRPGLAGTPQDVEATLTGHHITLRRLNEIIAERPVDKPWADVARAADQIVLVIGMAPVEDGDLDGYTDRYGHEVAIGLIRLTG